MGRSLRVWDPFGYPLEFFHAIEQFETQHQRFDLHRARRSCASTISTCTPRRSRRRSGSGWRSASAAASTSRPTAERRADHRRMAAAQAHRPRCGADRGTRSAPAPLRPFGSPSRPACCGPATSSPRGIRSEVIERGPGRHGVSNAFFVYLRDPDGHRIELYSCDYYTGDPDHEPLRWSVNDPRCRSFWGARAPDSWYEESS